MKQRLFHTVSGKSKQQAIFSSSFLSLILALVVLVSCKKHPVTPEPTPEPTYHLNLSATSVQSPSVGTTTNISVEANSTWQVSLPAGVDWVEVNKTTGNGNDAIQVKVTKQNNTGAKRNAVITVSLVNGKAPAKQITVEQDFTVAAPITINWKKVLGGSGNDYAYSIIKSSDGGYLLSGRTTSNNNGDVAPTKGGIDMWVVKLDAAGAIQWQKTYGGNADEYSVAAAVTPDNGYVLTGYTLSSNNGDVGQNHGNTDFWVVKINAAGAIQWQKTLGGTADDRPLAVTITTEGRIAVGGYTNSNNNGDVGANHGAEDMWVMLLDNGNGNFLWKKTFGGNGSEFAKALAPAPDGGVYVGGTTTSNNNGDVGPSKGNTDFWVLQLDRNLNIVWKNSLGGTNIEELNALAVGPNNTLIAAGSTKSNNNGDVGAAKGGEDIWVVQLNAATGALGWQKLFGGTAIDVARGVLVKANGNIVVAAYSYSNNGGDIEGTHGAGDYFAIALNSTGNILWKKLLGGDDEDLATSIADGSDGGFVIAGYTRTNDNGDIGPNKGNSDIWIVKLKDE